MPDFLLERYLQQKNSRYLLFPRQKDFSFITANEAGKYGSVITLLLTKRQ